jgi:hypothetical protein
MRYASASLHFSLLPWTATDFFFCVFPSDVGWPYTRPVTLEVNPGRLGDP